MDQKGGDLPRVRKIPPTFSMESPVSRSVELYLTQQMNFQSRHLHDFQRVESITNLKQFYGRIIVVSNRLPVNVTEKTGNDVNKDDPESRWEFKMSSGG